MTLLDVEQSEPKERTFYRRVTRAKWDKEEDKPEATAFRLGSGQAGISVFDSSIAAPDDVLVDQIEMWKRDERSKELQKYGTTPEELRRNGFHVIEIKASTFIELGFIPDYEHIEENGHLEILGSEEDFLRYAPDLVRACKPV